MAPAEYQILNSVASPPTIDSDHKKEAADWFREVLEPKADEFFVRKPNSPCFTAGSTADMNSRLHNRRTVSDRPAFVKHGKDGADSVYGDHYRTSAGNIDPRNLLVLGRAHNSYLQAAEDLVREKIRTLTAQSKNQNKVGVSGVYNKSGYGTLYILAAPDGPRDMFLKAEAAHKANRNLFVWCKKPANKNKGEVAYTPSTTTISNAFTAIEVVLDLLGAGWPAETLDKLFRGSGQITPTDKKLLHTMLSKKDEFGADTLMTLMWRTHLPETGPTCNKFTFVKENLTVAIEAFKQRTNADEAQSVATKRALDIATEASASTKRSRLEDDVVEIVDSD